LATRIAPSGHPDIFKKRFVLVDDETMSFLAETATQVDTRIKLDPRTRVVADKALWTEESLPPESVLIGILAADRSRHRSIELSPEDIMEKALPDSETMLQFGGKATTGHGRCRLVRL
jgi:CRISPR-associated protein Cmr4